MNIYDHIGICGTVVSSNTDVHRSFWKEVLHKKEALTN